MGLLAFLGVWLGGALLIGFGVGMLEMIGLTLVATAAFVLANRQSARERAASS
jgi:hypothetical protein